MNIRSGAPSLPGQPEDCEKHGQAAWRHAALFDLSEDALITHSLDGIVTGWNRAAERLFGYLAPDIIGQPNSIITPAERAAEEGAFIEQIKRGESIDRFETRGVRNDASVIPISMAISPIKDASGAVVEVARIVCDSAKQKTADGHFQLVVEAAPSAMLMVGETGNITLVNSQAERLFGYPREELLGRQV